jgi:hypothetical protein
LLSFRMVAGSGFCHQSFRGVVAHSVGFLEVLGLSLETWSWVRQPGTEPTSLGKSQESLGILSTAGTCRRSLAWRGSWGRSLLPGRYMRHCLNEAPVVSRTPGSNVSHWMGSRGVRLSLVIKGGVTFGQGSPDEAVEVRFLKLKHQGPSLSLLPGIWTK